MISTRRTLKIFFDKQKRYLLFYFILYSIFYAQVKIGLSGLLLKLKMYFLQYTLPNEATTIIKTTGCTYIIHFTI
jgi:hypothetical protein